MKKIIPVLIAQFFLPIQTLPAVLIEGVIVEEDPTLISKSERFIFDATLYKDEKTLVISICQKVGGDAVLMNPRGPLICKETTFGVETVLIRPVSPLPANDFKYIRKRYCEKFGFGDKAYIVMNNLDEQIQKEVLKKGVKFRFLYTEIKHIPDLSKSENPMQEFWNSFIEAETDWIPVRMVSSNSN